MTKNTAYDLAFVALVKFTNPSRSLDSDDGRQGWSRTGNAPALSKHVFDLDPFNRPYVSAGFHWPVKN